MDARQQALTEWLMTELQLSRVTLQALPADASFRRYFRVQIQGKSVLAMDAPPSKENCQPYIAIANALRAQGLCTPVILAQDVQQGFLLITDFGDSLYLKELTSNNAVELYGIALQALHQMQRCLAVPGWTLPLFTTDFMFQELNLFKEWFLVKHLDLTLTAETQALLTQFFYFLAETAANQPQVFMHRDYHSANLMCLPRQQVGILDFQDAFMGPITYDLVSLLRDCYIAWPTQLVTQLALQFHRDLTIKVSQTEFLRWFDLMGLQRHLKALLTFARKFHRDNNSHYLKHIPRTLNYVMQISQCYPECKPFLNFLRETALCAV